LGTVVAQMLRALTGYAIVCVLGYLGWQYISPAPPAIVAAPVQVASAAPAEISAASQTRDNPAAHRKMHHPKKRADLAPPEPADTPVNPNIAPSSDAVDSVGQ